MRIRIMMAVVVGRGLRARAVVVEVGEGGLVVGR